MHELSGVDVLHLMNDRVTRARGTPGNHCAFALTLEGRLSAGALERRLEDAVRALPELRARLDSPLVGPPRWAPRGRFALPFRLRARFDDEHALDVLPSLLAERLDGEQPWAVDLVRLREHDVVVYRWFHSLCDAKGAERLLAYLGSPEAAGAPGVDERATERWASPERALAKLERRERIALAKKYGAHLEELGRVPTRSLSSVSPRHGAQTRTVRVVLDEAETRRFDARARALAKLAETHVMLLAALRALDEVFVGRGVVVPRFVVPVASSMDPKGASGRLFGNHVVMLMLSLDRALLFDDARALARLAEEQRDAVRRKLDLAMGAALSFGRWLPHPVLRFATTRALGGELATVVFSNPGAIGLGTFLGHTVRDALPLPAVVDPPGAQVIFTRFAGKLSAAISTLDGALTGAEEARMASTLRAELLGERAPA